MHTFTSGPLQVHVLPSKTYKTNTILIHMRAPLDEETVTKRALLPYVLQNGTERHPSRQHIRRALDELYGATLNVDVSKKGESHLMTIRLDVANEKFLKDKEPLLEKGIELLASVLLSPTGDNDRLDKEIVEGEKRTLKQKLDSVYDDKMRYANKRLTEVMCEKEPFGLFVLGDKNKVDDIDEKSLYEYYEHVLLNDVIDMYVLGDVNENDMKNMIEKYFIFPEGSKRPSEKNKKVEHKAIEDAKEVIEDEDISQGKLHIGYRTGVTFGDDDYFALQLFNGIFGAFSHSKLFVNVREKASLAYYAASRVESHKGLLIVMSGIESNKYDDATEIIFKQMEDMKNGQFTEDDIEQTKAVYKNQLLETMDVPRGLIELTYHNELTENIKPISEWMSEIDKVNKEDIVRVAEKVQLDTVYFLKGKGGHSNE
ncbi:EF-P 5-aminopentanol modification-associated protein YfmF [Evansella halocellulosilytica]|uniref:EF-P 5-aminopentanol modification-associated protein YfmF n=1 Tax=Evansella halocellulosilytica TaxID=2011013 RepID=UPI000BB6DDA7|nr:pitrilysin family protein [Evansella halocellulosilytica]